jgi:hypothetical protein
LIGTLILRRKSSWLMTDPSNSELKTNFDQFGPELVYFSNCILQDIAPESAKKAWPTSGSFRRCSSRKTRSDPCAARLCEPTEEQEIHRPPVGKPQLVKAAGCHDAGLSYMPIAASASVNSQPTCWRKDAEQYSEA